MIYTRLIPELPPSSVLGFGCAGIMGRVGRGASLRAVAAALDAGITHFDVARSYGYGEAELLLGEALRGRRERVVVVTKLGVEPRRSAGALARLKPLARSAIAAFPGLRPLVRRAASSGVARRRFSVEAARRSLDASLAALGTDYIDILLLHGPALEDVDAALIEFLDDAVRRGKLRTCGVTASLRQVLALQAAWPSLTVRQFRSSLLRPWRALPAGAVGPSLTHSPFEGAERLLAWARSRAGDIARLGLPPIGPKELHRLMLAYALGVNPAGVVICSMLSPDHVRENASVVDDPPFTKDQVEGFARLVEGSGLLLEA